MRDNLRDLGNELDVGADKTQREIAYVLKIVRDFLIVDDPSPTTVRELFDCITKEGMHWVINFVEMVQGREELPAERTEEVNREVAEWAEIHHPDWRREDEDIAKWDARQKDLKARGIWPAGVRPPDWESYLYEQKQDA
jgi:hypothetical protein